LEIHYRRGALRERLGMDKHVAGVERQNHIRSISVSILQAPIILMSQNRQSHKDRLRAEIDYQVNLTNELALNEILERLRALEHKYREQMLDEYDVSKVP
jgi:uncharacterized membrane protein